MAAPIKTLHRIIRTLLGVGSTAPVGLSCALDYDELVLTFRGANLVRRDLKENDAPSRQKSR